MWGGVQGAIFVLGRALVCVYVHIGALQLFRVQTSIFEIKNSVTFRITFIRKELLYYNNMLERTYYYIICYVHAVICMYACIGQS